MAAMLILDPDITRAQAKSHVMYPGKCSVKYSLGQILQALDAGEHSCMAPAYSGDR